MDLDVSLCLPRESGTVGLIRRVAAGALGTMGVTPACIDDVVLALSEACSNVVDHAAVEDQYEVRLEVRGRRCAIAVEDAGGGFDAAALADVPADTSSVRGRGVAIMRAVMDQVDFESAPQRGTIVRLVKTLDLSSPGPLGAIGRSWLTAPDGQPPTRR
ncbi:MAG TPA: ATP-binding protein [Solirubrobacterales bacterium]|nr:ATP-binding protein [Solirubrobacterales bacterium]